MEKSPKYCPSLLLCLITLVSFCSCNRDAMYKRTYTADERLKLSETLLNNAGSSTYYQGSVAERMIIHEGIRYNPESADGQREIGVPYLKRGFASEAYHYYSRAAQRDPEEWLGYKAYCWLYFYRDYKTVLADVEQYDALTPDYVDYPQSTSVNYMRGICHLRLGNYKEAISYLSMHLDKEIQDVGAKYVEPVNYLHLGIAYHKAGESSDAARVFDAGLQNNENIAELHYYKAVNLLSQGSNKEARTSLEFAQEWFSKGGPLTRSYVEEFYALYQEDLNQLMKVIEG